MKEIKRSLDLVKAEIWASWSLLECISLVKTGHGRRNMPTGRSLVGLD